MAKAPDYIGGYPLLNEFMIKSTDKPRRVVVRLRRGITVRGTVRDSRTEGADRRGDGRPGHPRLAVLGARRGQAGQDRRRRALRGPRRRPALGVSATHPDYIHDLEFPDGKTIGPNHDVFLERGVTIAVDGRRRRRQAAGRGDGRGPERQAGHVGRKDGRLVLRNPGLVLGLTFRKDGFIDRKLDAEEIRRELPKPEGLVVVMERLIGLTGRVVAPDGRPVAAFTVAAGPGELPPRSDSVRREVQDRDGRFSLDLSKPGTTWVGVAAEGFAAWEGWVEVKRGGPPLEVRLSPGVAVTARVVVPEAAEESRQGEARPAPRQVGHRRNALRALCRGSSRPARRPSRPTARCGFDHVRPDRYRLIIEGPGVPETALALDVPDAGLRRRDRPHRRPHCDRPHRGPRLASEVQGRGVVGVRQGLCRRIPLRRHSATRTTAGIAFQADENGRFKVDRVPVGLTTVGFPYQVFDVINSYTWSALVVEGQTTKVRAFEPEGAAEFTLAFAIGDGSKAQYESGTGLGASRKVDNVTVSSRAVRGVREEGSDAARADVPGGVWCPFRRARSRSPSPTGSSSMSQRKVVLPDVGPGTYRLRVYDWFGSRDLDSGPLFDREVVVPPGGRGEVTIALGAGCITGKIPAPDEQLRASRGGDRRRAGGTHPAAT